MVRLLVCDWNTMTRREFPASLVAEHKAAVKAFFTKFALVVSAIGVALATLVSKLFF